MGCGSSSLKGEKHEEGAAEPAKPMKKVATNFSTVDYDNPTNQGRRNTEYAPHDEIKPHKPSEALSPLTEKKSNPIDHDAIAQPAAATQPGSATAATTTPAIVQDTVAGNQTALDPVGDHSAPKQPYKDITTDSPSSPTAPNVVNAFPESHDTTKPQTQ